MCGIVAVIGPAPRPVSALLADVASRGPDCRRTAERGTAAIGAARLRVVGDLRGDQPMLGRRGSLGAWNGEAFNHAASGLAEEFGSDFGPVLEQFESEGVAAFARVRGPFAAAILSADGATLTLARDESAVRPLFLAKTSRSIAAASEPWALVRALGADALADADAVSHLLAYQFPPPDRGLVRGVAPVAAGTARTFRALADGAVVEDRPQDASYAGAVEPTIEDALRASARLQGPSARRSAIFLSGGLDSSSLLGLLAEVDARPSIALVGWFPEGGPELDERVHARAVAAECGVPLIETPVTAASAWEAFPAMIRALGGPCAGPGALASYVLAAAAKAESVDVVFTGQGGDEWFGGYERHRILARMERGRPPGSPPEYAELETAMRSAADPLRAAVVRGDALRPLLERDAARAMDEAVLATLPEKGPNRTERALRFERTTFLPGLLAVDDRAFGAFGIEGRVPLLDPAVVRRADGIGIADLLLGGTPRAGFRRAAGTALPKAAALRRDKMGFPMPLARWMAGPWRAAMADLLSGDATTSFGFRRGAARDAFLSGSLKARDAWFIAALATFENELRVVRAAPDSSTTPLAAEGAAR